MVESHSLINMDINVFNTVRVWQFGIIILIH